MLSVQPLPPDQLQDATEAVRTLEEHPQGQVHLHLSGSGGQADVALPPQLMPLLRAALDHLASGNGIQLLPLQPDLTTKEAADLLQISRPHLMRLVDQGKLPYHMVGTHHRLKLADVLGFKEVRDSKRASALNALAQESQAMGLR